MKDQRQFTDEASQSDQSFDTLRHAASQSQIIVKKANVMSHTESKHRPAKFTDESSPRPNAFKNSMPDRQTKGTKVERPVEQISPGRCTANSEQDQ